VTQFDCAEDGGALLRVVASVCVINFVRGGLVGGGYCCCGGGGWGGGGVLGGAFGLQLAGVEDAVVSIGAYGEGLGIVLEGIGRGFGALVDDGEFASLLEEVEGGVGAYAMDAARGYVAGYAEVANVGFVAHALKFSNGDVVALVIASAAEGEIGDGAEDDHGGDNEFDRAFMGFVWHRASAFRLSVYVGSSLRLLLRFGYWTTRRRTPHPPTILCKVHQKMDLDLDFHP